MQKPKDFKIGEGHSVFRPTGEIPLPEAVQLVTSALAYAREHKIRKLLIDTSGLTGFEPPTIATRYFFVKDWAAAAQGSVIVAMVARPEMIDHEKFGVTAAANAGLRADVFETEKEAVAWLEGEE